MTGITNGKTIIHSMKFLTEFPNEKIILETFFQKKNIYIGFSRFPNTAMIFFTKWSTRPEVDGTQNVGEMGK